MAGKGEDAFRTIGELSAELGVPQHVLRYWETRFAQLRPLQRAGNRRYYRPTDVALARRIDQLLNHEGYTVKGVQKLLEGETGAASAVPQPADEPRMTQEFDVAALRSVREMLARALAEDEMAAG